MKAEYITGPLSEKVGGPALPNKVVFCTPTRDKPHPKYVESLDKTDKVLQANGWQTGVVFEVGNPYISVSRSIMLRKALDADATHIIFIDGDVSWEPRDVWELLTHPDEVVAGTYRYKYEPEDYMGNWMCDPEGYPIVAPDGSFSAGAVPAGFLRLSRKAVNTLYKAYPELVYGEPSKPHIDLFCHGAHQGVWWGEDYAFSRRWTEKGGRIALLPYLNIVHHTKDQSFPGCLKTWLEDKHAPTEKHLPVSEGSAFNLFERRGACAA